ncbi:GNAT family N-acetyltransferase [Halogeometricum sp. S1BR25-6]|uniref:GNAT family N-acetyltransferase n=1 Tax=Halogeometricum salsisoli TaxID=2950536 RepID=A0ABU2GBL9_9EURY|nr:GNAT family N-acetyltransferase [Halogeometricum sp. S1BR25-6]MDS0298211.1 GNAT family N-acetyltransferase [Halogeometricum sp. S1BR25-6]
MDLRDATTDDVAQIRSVAEQSMTSSYGHAIDEATIDEAVEEWYDADAVGDALEEEESVFVVAVDDGEVVGFVQAYVSTGQVVVGEIDWLHVLPEHRGEGIGTQLLKRVEQVLSDRGVDLIEGRVLTDNEAGADFYAEQGYEEASERTIGIGGEEFDEVEYVKRLGGEDEPALTEERTIEDGTTVYVAYDDAVRGSRAPFYAAYMDEERTERYGWMCGQDESFDVAMDTMERIECNTCRNRRKAARWDAAYL